MKISAYKCDECKRLVEKADNLMIIGRQGKGHGDLFNKYKMEIRFFSLKKENGETGKAMDLCEDCKKYISGAGELNGAI